MKKDCKIVQDLLPSYIEKLTSKDTNEYVEGHLKTCEDCTKVCNDMKADLKANVTSPKAEIDYMKKVRKKMKIAEKLLYIVLLLFIIFVLVFWREIFSFICYTDICNRYLKYQAIVLETKKYSVYTRDNQRREQDYYTPERKMSRTDEAGSDETRLFGTILNSNIDGTCIAYQAVYNYSGEQMYPITLIYVPNYENSGELQEPYYPTFDFDKKSTFWELMSTFDTIRNIRIVEDKYEIDIKDSDTKYYLYRGDRFELAIGSEKMTLKAGEVSEEDMNMVNLETDNITLMDYEMPNRNRTEKITKKLSNCEQEAGTVVSYDFKISKNDSTNLLGLKEDDTNKNILMAKITNNITYKEFQKKMPGLRDLTDEDFVNYCAIIVVDKDSAKEIHYAGIEESEKVKGEVDLKLTEETSTNDLEYSASLVILPNTMENGFTPFHIMYYNAKIVN